MALIGPEYVAVLDPFSKEGKEIVKASPPLDQMPPEIANLAVERVGKSDREMAVQFNSEAVRADVLSFYLACQGVAAVSYPFSRETRLLSEATNRTIKYRMYDLFRRGHEDFCLETVQRSFNFLQLDRENGVKLGKLEIPREDYFKLRDKRLAEDGIEIVDDRLLAQYIPKYAVRWTDLALLLKNRKVELTKLYLINGWAVISPRELWDLFASFVSAKTEDYVASVYERFSDGGPPSKLLVDVGERIASLLPPEVELLGKFARLPAGKLKPELFPPCVRKCLVGVGAGLRNYAITVLLTSFLSYARVSPSGKMVSRMADFISDVSIVRDDIASSIFEAADRCNPPLFKDQPQEKANVYYHLGFGMTTEPRLEDSGKSKWYRTPNCRKVQMSTPPLCDPDELCRTLKNPLTYYYRRLFEQSKLSAGD